jgi:uncharacterized protein YecA (UPF0149 family)
LNEQNVSENLELLATADQLQLQELVDYLQKYLIENKSVCNLPTTKLQYVRKIKNRPK